MGERINDQGPQIPTPHDDKQHEQQGSSESVIQSREKGSRKLSTRQWVLLLLGCCLALVAIAAVLIFANDQSRLNTRDAFGEGSYRVSSRWWCGTFESINGTSRSRVYVPGISQSTENYSFSSAIDDKKPALSLTRDEKSKFFPNGTGDMSQLVQLRHIMMVVSGKDDISDVVQSDAGGRPVLRATTTKSGSYEGELLVIDASDNDVIYAYAMVPDGSSNTKIRKTFKTVFDGFEVNGNPVSSNYTDYESKIVSISATYDGNKLDGTEVASTSNFNVTANYDYGGSEPLPKSMSARLANPATLTDGQTTTFVIEAAGLSCSVDVTGEHRATVEEQNALLKANSYAKNMHMSKRGIYDQLVSEYGERFSEEAARYAVENMTADWNANALATAKTYQSTMHMSKSAIYDQLVSKYGEQFTPEEAQYAIDNLPD